MIPKHMIEQGAHGIAEHRTEDVEGLLGGPMGIYMREDAAAALAAVLGSQEQLARRLYGALEQEWECYPEIDALGRPIRCGHHERPWEAEEDRCEEAWIIATTCAELIFAEEVGS